MAILNYTTKIDSSKTLAEIQKILASAGASAISIDYDKGRPIGLAFSLAVQGKPMAFRLPARYGAVLKVMKRDKVEPRYCTEEHALRVAWRIIKDWVAAQMALIDAELADMAEVFMPYVITRTGSTMYEEFQKQGFPLLPGPKE